MKDLVLSKTDIHSSICENLIMAEFWTKEETMNGNEVATRL